MTELNIRESGNNRVDSTGGTVKNHKLTLIGLAISVVLLLSTLIAKVDIFEAAVGTLNNVEKYEVDEFIIPAIIFAFFAFIDLVRRQKQQKIELERLKIYRAMLSSTHHILNNFLNQVQLFKITAEETPGFDPVVLNLYDQTIDDASRQIEALGSITNIDEASIQKSVAPQTNAQQDAAEDAGEPS